MTALISSTDKPVSPLTLLGLPLGWCLAAFMAWLALWRAGFPAPHVDDLFFSGPAVSIAVGEGLRNPWIEPWLRQFGSDAYFAQLPLHPHLLGLWLTVWGVSTSSLLAFQCLAGCTLCVTSAALLRRAGCPPWSIAAACLVATAFVLDKGLRPEPWSASFAVLAICAWRQPGQAGWTLGTLAAAASVLVHPFAIVIMLPAALVVFFCRAKNLAPSEVLVCLIIGATVTLFAFGLISWLLDFRIIEFWESFQAHARLRTPASGHRLASFWESVTVGREPWLKGPVTIAFTAALIVCWCDGKREHAVVAAFVVAAGLALGIACYAGNCPLWLWPAAGGLALALWSRVRSVRWRALGAAFTTAAMLWGVAPQLLRLLAVRAEPPASYVAIRAEIERLQPTRLLVDETAARFVYDFDLPRGARDWLLTRGRDFNMVSSLATKPVGETWLVDARKVSLYVPDAGLTPARVLLRGIGATQWLARPYQLHLFP